MKNSSWPSSDWFMKKVLWCFSNYRTRVVVKNAKNIFKKIKALEYFAINYSICFNLLHFRFSFSFTHRYWPSSKSSKRDDYDIWLQYHHSIVDHNDSIIFREKFPTSSDDVDVDGTLINLSCQRRTKCSFNRKKNEQLKLSNC